MDTAQATNPARLPFSSARYLKCHPGLLLLPLMMLVLMATLALIKRLSLYNGAAIGIVMAIAAIPMAVASVRRKLQDGNLCAAMVVSTSPYTVAVLTDLCKDRSGPQLAVKIVKAPLDKIIPSIKKGDRLPAASTYFGDSGSGAWQDFHPLVAPCACTNEAEIKRAVASIDANDWIILSQAMKSLKPTSFGLHHLST